VKTENIDLHIFNIANSESPIAVAARDALAGKTIPCARCRTDAAPHFLAAAAAPSPSSLDGSFVALCESCAGELKSPQGWLVQCAWRLFVGLEPAFEMSAPIIQKRSPMAKVSAAIPPAECAE
jgi:hypothetical protein